MSFAVVQWRAGASCPSCASSVPYGAPRGAPDSGCCSDAQLAAAGAGWELTHWPRSHDVRAPSGAQCWRQWSSIRSGRERSSPASERARCIQQHPHQTRTFALLQIAAQQHAPSLHAGLPPRPSSCTSHAMHTQHPKPRSPVVFTVACHVLSMHAAASPAPSAHAPHGHAPGPSRPPRCPAPPAAHMAAPCTPCASAAPAPAPAPASCFSCSSGASCSHGKPSGWG